MATVTLESYFRGDSVPLGPVQKQYDAFLKKWKEDIEECSGPEYLFAGSTGQTLSLLGVDVHFTSVDRFHPPTAGIFRFFSSDSGTGTGCEVGLGVGPFPPEFYRELYNLFAGDDGNCTCEWEVLMWVSSDSTAFYGTAALTAKGLEWDFQRDKSRDEEDEESSELDEYTAPKHRKKPIWLHVIGRLPAEHLAKAMLAGGGQAEFFWNRGWYFYRDLYVGLTKPNYSELHIGAADFILHCDYSPRRLPQASAKDFHCHVLACAADERVYKLSDEDLNGIVEWYRSLDHIMGEGTFTDTEDDYAVALDTWVCDIFRGADRSKYQQVGVDGDWVDIERLPMAE